MMWLLLALHAVGVLAVLAVGRARLATAPLLFTVAALAPAASALVAIGALASGRTADESFEWVGGLDLDVALRLDPLTAVLALIVSGVGVAVFAYAAGYFAPDSPGLARFAATLLAFSGSMLGLVLADSIWTLFVFWELTSITSFVLVGHKTADPSAQLAARRAFLITAAGGLALLAGLVLFADASGSTRLRDLEPLGGTGAGLAAVLVITAAATKSAQVPFHVWLPGAMAAPTPVSAYLHSATMVKAGVIVLAVLQPALVETAPWTPLVMGFGLVSMLWGAIGALRQVDAKLILAWGTVSQLGLMVALLSVGTPKATFAALSILVAHAVFKAALFMVVGEIDVRTANRDIRVSSGLWQVMPVACAVAVASGLSMAGIPPLLGFTAKEAGIEAVLGLSGAERTVMLVGVVGGSVLTVAYTARLLIGLFGGPRPTAAVGSARPPMSAVTIPLGMGSLFGFVALGTVSAVVAEAAAVIDPGAAVYELLRWPGPTMAFVVSVAIVVVGTVVGVVLARRIDDPARALGAQAVDAVVDTTLRSARTIAARVQHGSLPGYLLTMAVATAAATVPFAVDVDPGSLRAWDHPAQVVLALLVLAAALGVLGVRNRLGAALALGAVGFGVAGLFVVHGAPDLALTQLLVETVIVVGFVVGLRHLGRDFTHLGRLWRSARIAAAVSVGAGVTLALAAAGSEPTGTPPLDRIIDGAVDEGGGNNVVNVILTDIRALDTWGEILVLVVVAVGIVSLARPGSGSSAADDERRGDLELVEAGR